jgi:hypothetical protein
MKEREVKDRVEALEAWRGRVAQLVEELPHRIGSEVIARKRGEVILQQQVDGLEGALATLGAIGMREAINQEIEAFVLELQLSNR